MEEELARMNTATCQWLPSGHQPHSLDPAVLLSGPRRKASGQVYNSNKDPQDQSVGNQIKTSSLLTAHTQLVLI